eukprot:scaffold9301_cov30-Tisochrysis_lutea.AAC.12
MGAFDWPLKDDERRQGLREPSATSDLQSLVSSGAREEVAKAQGQTKAFGDRERPTASVEGIVV